MNYQVDWLSGAEDKLVKIWLAARDRQYLREAIDTFEQQCAINPLNLGESRHDMFRVVFVGPLTIWIKVDPATKTVNVCAIERNNSNL
jgi:mRNA-degrading endonuclease RelE of RelBE toxin-antitoxin system